MSRPPSHHRIHSNNLSCLAVVSLSLSSLFRRHFPRWIFSRFLCMFTSSPLIRYIAKKYSTTMSGIPLNTVLAQFKEYAPLHLADQSWDNVGLLVEPHENNPSVERIFFTNDLTEPVLEEAIERQAQLIVSYHPPIFSGLKRLTQSSWKERIVLKCIRHGIAVYSPHTSWDAVDTGINNWLISAFGKGRTGVALCYRTVPF
jgi:hypothetical protein